VYILWLTAFVFALDQLTKRAVQSSLSPYQSKPVIQDFFHLTYVTNDGMAFGLSMPGGRSILLILSILLTIFIFWFLWQERNGHALVRIGLALILAGAFGNLLDRVLYGKVVDFLDFMIGDFHWYIFNVADSSVTIGMILFIFHSFFIEYRTVSAESKA
jgi:signal peptidase II|tara:strand:- start:991 stop:1467 length:477 start_codon:yes stop_codon:yes gene_type:complete